MVFLWVVLPVETQSSRFFKFFDFKTSLHFFIYKETIEPKGFPRILDIHTNLHNSDEVNQERSPIILLGYSRIATVLGLLFLDKRNYSAEMIRFSLKLHNIAKSISNGLGSSPWVFCLLTGERTPTN